ncbi:MAG TPA: DUF2079 domain-containing protein [Patescibacteria group bacterium]|nr:DUF2079 domain-containing protein [Patescibacteria group bacterium]
MDSLLKKVSNHRIIDVIVVCLTILFTLAGALVSLNRYWQYEVFYYNFGIFDQAIWHVSRFQPPIIEHLLVGGRWLFADHFDVSILLLAPVYWITDRSEVLLIVQAIFVGLAGFFIYKTGVAIFKDKLLALSIAWCYFFFVGIQNAIITDFHEVTIMTLPVALTFFAIVTKRKKLFWVTFLITLGFKEVTFLLGCGIAIFLFFYNKAWRKQAVIAAIVALLWGFLAMKVFIPYFSQGLYLHWPDLPESVLDKVVALGDHPLKRETLFFSFLQYGFLSAFAPGMWFAILQEYVLRFLPKFHYTYWTLGLHYNAVVSVLLSLSAVFGFSFLLRYKVIQQGKYLLALLLMLNAFVLFRFVHHGPFLLAVHPVFYEHTKDFAFLDSLIARIPKDSSIMTQNNLGVRFTHQEFIFLRQNYEPYAPDYVLLDVREGQNPNNFLFGPDIPELITKLQRDSNYDLIYHQGEQYIFKRK